MNITCRCQHCKDAYFIVKIKRKENPFAFTITCNFCGMETAFIAYYPKDENITPEGKAFLITAHPLKSDQYICVECLEVFEKVWSDEEALEVAKKMHNNPDFTLDNTERVCEDCFNNVIIPTLN